MRLCDFGDARDGAWTTTTKDVGTAPYMAPELLLAAEPRPDAPLPYGAEVDVYAFGVLLWRLCHREDVFTAFTSAHLDGAAAAAGGPVSEELFKEKVRAGARLPIDEARCPAGWRALMEDCWRTDGGRRPSMAEVLQRLEPPSPRAPVEPVSVAGCAVA